MPHLVANGIRLYCEVHGDGPPLVLVEGIGYASWMWFRQVEALSSHHRLVVYDNRCVGRSDKPDSDFTIRDMADDLAALLDGLGIARTHLMGVSMGGFIAQEFALAYPERLDRLILVCTGFGGPEMVPIPAETQKLMVPDPDLPPEQRIRKAMAPSFAPGYAEAHPEIVDEIVRMRLASVPPLDAWMRQAQAAAAFDTSARMSRITAPTLILHGDQDRVVPAENAHLLAQRIPTSRLAILPNAGHLLFIEQPQQFNQVVLDFLR